MYPDIILLLLILVLVYIEPENNPVATEEMLPETTKKSMWTDTWVVYSLPPFLSV